MMEMKTFAWAEIVFGIVDLGLGIILYLTETYFKREVSILLIVGGWGIFGGLCLLCLGGKPSYSCVKVNTLLQLATFVASCAGVATLARHVPYKESDMSRDAEVLVNRVLAFFIAVLVLQALMNLVVMVMGVCSMFDPSPESADPERIGSTTTTEKLCPPPQQQQQQQQQVMAAGEDLKWADADST